MKLSEALEIILQRAKDTNDFASGFYDMDEYEQNEVAINIVETFIVNKSKEIDSLVDNK